MNPPHPEDMPRDNDRVDMNFELVAERYSGRISYAPAFFAKAAEIFDLSKSSTVLDLGCGTGALALGFAPYCKSVLAVDKSASMMSHRRGSPDNVRFLLADLNAEITTLPVRADLVIIGMAVHLFDREKLIPLLDAVTTPSAAVFICGTTISPETPWFAHYSKLRKQYSTLKVPLDVYGEARFSDTPWSRGRSLRVTTRARFSARNLLDHALSYPCSLEGILKDKDGFERNLETLLSPYCRTPGHADGKVVSWGLEYRRN
jgi:ubiquinone/menaquinone biosynthesis C-methylase UbiE